MGFVNYISYAFFTVHFIRSAVQWINLSCINFFNEKLETLRIEPRAAGYVALKRKRYHCPVLSPLTPQMKFLYYEYLALLPPMVKKIVIYHLELYLCLIFSPHYSSHTRLIQ